MSSRQFSNVQLIWRALSPSPSSAFACILLGFLVAISHILLLSVNYGTALPGVLDGQWAAYYTEHVAQPLSAFFANGVFNRLLVALMWGVVGLVVYGFFEYALHAFGTMRRSSREVALRADGTWEQGTVQYYFLQSLIWRVAVIAFGAVGLVLMRPLFQYALQSAPQAVMGSDLRQNLGIVIISGLIWTLFFHFLVVLLRLYTQRTRLFGDDVT